MQQKLCVLEVNEVPPTVWQLYARKYPSSSIAQILANGKSFRTMADDVDVDSLYPSQTWASLNTGLPYSKHKIHWYNDPKPNLDFFWWHEAALAGRSVGLVNVLHTSPLASLTSTGNYSFVLPDCFAPDASTLPSHFQKFQRLNLLLTKSSGRRASLRASTLAGLAGRAMLNPGSFGVSAFTLSQCARALPGIMQSPERLRNLQFPPLATIFMSMLKKCDPDVAVFFTNHVAAAQHRYWYALFPGDYAEELYPKSWVEKYETDILQAMDMLDRYLKKLTAFCVDSNRILVVASSMGQHANKKLTRASIKNKDWDFRIDTPERLMSLVLGGSTVGRFEAAMIPQYTFSFQSIESAAHAAIRLREWIQENDCLEGGVDTLENKVTLTLKVIKRTRELLLHGKSVQLSALGIVELEIDDHHSGRHQPIGTLLVWNDHQDLFFPATSTPVQFSYLEYASQLRAYLGLKGQKTPSEVAPLR